LFKALSLRQSDESGKKIFVQELGFSGAFGILYVEVYKLLASAVKILFLPSLKFYSSSKKCTATWPGRDTKHFTLQVKHIFIKYGDELVFHQIKC
jgi:hypothetical protein